MSITESLEIIQAAMPIKGENEHMKFFGQMATVIKQKTNDFTNPEGISTKKLSMKPILEKEGIPVDAWKKEKGSLERSELDAVLWLSGNLQEIMIAEAEAEAELELLKLSNN